MALDAMKATIEKTVARSLAGGVGRGRFAVTCTCGRRNIFDAFSWAGHGALKCKKCRRYIDQTGAVGDSRDDLK
jgi:cytosine/adenosine deaminase-related metal-dependent hydrolase